MTAAPAGGQAKILIVNADDFGLTAGVSRGILEAHRHGIVTSTTLLVNREIPPSLIEELAASDLGVGVHLNLTLGSPVASANRVPSLVDAEGRFIRDAREASARAKVDEARIELGTQIDAFRTIMGRFPTHLDSHHHVGRHSPILDLVLDFARALPGLAKGKVYARIIMTPQHAKLLKNALQDNIEKFERQFGEIRVDNSPSGGFGFQIPGGTGGDKVN